MDNFAYPVQLQQPACLQTAALRTDPAEVNSTAGSEMSLVNSNPLSESELSSNNEENTFSPVKNFYPGAPIYYQEKGGYGEYRPRGFRPEPRASFSPDSGANVRASLPPLPVP